MSEERKYTGFAAIYQLEQERLRREKSQSADDPPPPERPVEGTSHAPATTPPAQDNAPLTAGDEAGAEPRDEAAPRAETVLNDRPLRPARPVAVGATAATRAPRRAAAARTAAKVAPGPSAVADSAEAHAVRWKQLYRLNKGETNVMKVMYGLSHALGTDTCHIKVGEVAEAAGLKKRRCQYVIRSLETLGFLERLGEYDPSNRLGLKYRVHLRPARPDLE